MFVTNRHHCICTGSFEPDGRHKEAVKYQGVGAFNINCMLKHGKPLIQDMLSHVYFDTELNENMNGKQVKFMESNNSRSSINYFKGRDNSSNIHTEKEIIKEAQKHGYKFIYALRYFDESLFSMIQNSHYYAGQPPMPRVDIHSYFINMIIFKQENLVDALIQLYDDDKMSPYTTGKLFGYDEESIKGYYIFNNMRFFNMIGKAFDYEIDKANHDSYISNMINSDKFTKFTQKCKIYDIELLLDSATLEQIVLSDISNDQVNYT